MAAIVKRKKKKGCSYSVQIVTGPERRKVTFGLGDMNKDDVKSIAKHIEHLQRFRESGGAVSVPSGTAEWIKAIRGERLHQQLAKAGLVEAVEVATLGQFVDAFIEDQKPIVADSTLIKYGQARENLIECFGESKPLASFIEADGDRFRSYLIGKDTCGLGENTTRRRCGTASQFFAAAIRRRLITHNAFAHLPKSVQGNPEKFHFVSIEDYELLINAAPNLEWKLIISLCRIGGVRCPSEIAKLTWADIDFDRDRMRITSDKTKHHIGGAFRYCPLFPELAEVLREAKPLAKSDKVVPRVFADSNLRKPFMPILRKAGLTKWDKLFVNMRASRAIELRQLGTPEYLCTAWIGHSSATAQKHYLRTVDEDFTRAAKTLAKSLATDNASKRKSRPDGHNAHDRNVDSKELCGIGARSGKEGWAILDSNQ